MAKNSQDSPAKLLIDIWHRLTTSKIVPQNTKYHQQAHLLTAVLITLILLIILLFIPPALLAHSPSQENPDVYIMIGVLAIFVLAYRLNQTGHYQPAAFLTTISAAVGLLMVMTTNLSKTLSYQEITDKLDMLVFMVIPVLLANMLLSIPATGIVVLLSVTGMVVLALTIPQVTLIMLASGPLSFFLVVSTLSMLATNHHNRLALARQTQLAESEKKHRALAESLCQRERLLNATQRLTYVGGWEWDIEQQVMFWTDETYYIHGFSPQEIPPGAREHIEHSAECYAPEDRPVILAAFERCVEEGIGYDLEFPITTAQGQKKWIRTTAQAQKEDGKIIKVLGNFMDITEHKLAAEAMRESQERLDTAVESAGIGLWNWYIQTGETIFNERWAEIIGYTLEELQPVSIETWYTFVHPDDLEKSRSLLEQHFAGELDYYECEARMHHKNGNWVWILDRGRVVEWDKTGIPIRMAGAHTDITQRKQAEIALRASEMQYRSLIEQSEDAIYLLYNNKFEVINPKFTKIFGITQEEAQSPDFNFQRLVAPQSRAMVQKRQQKLSTGEELSPRYEFMALDRNGNEIAVEVSVSYIPYRNGRATQGILRDITKRKLSEGINAARWRLLQFSTAHSLDDLLEETLAEVEKLTNSTISFYHFVEEEKQSIKLQSWSVRTKTEYCQIKGKGMQYSIDQAGVWADCIRERKPIIHNDYPT
ncbi:MAG: PAS domain-containing protein, partial [Anaerolineae bacterium]|nr:PAS domain-containing protein [Anaerolineae bacterium]